MSLLASLFPTSKSIDKATDALIATGDKLWTTEEEKLEFDQKKREWFLKVQEATQGQNVARRLISLIVTFTWLFFLITGAIAKWLGNAELSTFMFDTLETNINTPFGIVMGFYFLAHVASRAKR